ncbi:DUF1540 domain-containing protein [Paludicola sp. MB14-C6]|uniref:DUF1540 domain-containing protein n=1 Tax=Paludihabitans sp. MB14-C6 TaxID=3070656 RepID=UPI0027DC1773|nr:DUF1540 domain-containing protein [Paludicola sp. MB14-C6]WMJ23940.1 DUF1540 domain-containing protein [Paludicola sp. MB14-C6]
MTDKNHDKPPINGICCDVENCIYNNHESGCTANTVKIGPQFATTCNDTACQSYQKQSC